MFTERYIVYKALYTQTVFFCIKHWAVNVFYHQADLPILPLSLIIKYNFKKAIQYKVVYNNEWQKPYLKWFITTTGMCSATVSVVKVNNAEKAIICILSFHPMSTVVKPNFLT